MSRWVVLAALACGPVPAARDGGDTLVNVTLSYPSSELEVVLGQPVALRPLVTGAPGFSVDPPLPTGLALDATSGVISGTPSASVDEGLFTVTAESLSGSATFALTLTVLPGFVVRATADGADDDNGVDGVCQSTVAGGCSLRAALQSANQRVTKQLILLDAATYTVTSALDAVANDVTIVGQGMRSTHIHPSVVHPGYGLLSLGAAHVLTAKKLSIDDFGMRNGGALSATAGAVFVDACSFNNNVGAGSGGVFFFSNGARATLTRSVFTSNSTFGGCCGGWGGVIDGEGANTTIVVKQCFATANSTAWGAFAHITTGTTLHLESTTLFGNKSVTAGTLASPGGTYTLVNDTIVANQNTNPTPDTGGIYLFQAPAHYTVSNTIVAFNTNVNNVEENCHRRDLATSVTSNGGNLFSDDAGNCATYFSAPGDRLSLDPGLSDAGPQDNGGLVATILLRPSSPAVGAGVTGQCAKVDARGAPLAGACDVGAVQLDRPADAGSSSLLPRPEARLGVGCGCEGAPLQAVVAAALLVRWVRRRPRRAAP